MTKFDENAFIEAFNDTYASDEEGPAPKRRRRFRKGSGRGPGRTRAVIIGTGIAAMGITGVVGAATGDNLREGVRNGTTTSETEIIANINAVARGNGGYSTRQSNLSSTGGGAIYGCRAAAQNPAPGSPRTNPCLRANNLSNGFAFEFNATNGESAGQITVGSGGDTKRPFTTNATGVATGLNADRVDGANASDIVSAATTAAAADATQKANAAKTHWALIGADGAIVAQSGGMSVVSAYSGDDNVYINTGVDATKRGLSATIAALDSGEIAAAACGLPTVACTPENTENANTVVVAPRDSNGAAPAQANRQSFYVTVTG